MIVCAIGDVHGRLDLLEAAADELRRTAKVATAEGKAFVTVFLGDYVDRGPNSSGVLAQLIALRHENLGDIIYLRGNHEQVMLDLADGATDPLPWLDYGGVETLQSYGVAHPPRGAAATNAELGRLIREAVPAPHLAFLRETQLYAKCGDYLFVHAGLRPDRLMEEQSVADMLWFRYYTDETPVHGEFVVHGHSTNSLPILGRWRIGIDTEAYNSGMLTILRLDGEDREFLQVVASGPDRMPTVTTWPKVDASYVRGSAPSSRSSGSSKMAKPVAPPRPKPRHGGLVRFGVLAPVVLVGAVIALALGALWAATNVSTRTPAAVAGATAPRIPVAPAVSATETSAPSLRLSADIGSQLAPATTPPVDGESLQEPLRAAAAGKATSSAETPESASTKAAAGRLGVAKSPAGARAQIGALDSEEQARSAWSALARKSPGAIRSYRLAVEPVQASGRTFYRAYATGFATVDDAKRFCRSLDSIDAPCIVRTTPQD